MKIGRRLLTDLTQFDLFAGKPAAATDKPTVTGEALVVRVDLIDEDPGNPRTEFPEADIHELAEDIRQQGLLQPIVVQPANAAGRYKIRFGALRLRAAVMAGLTEVPVTVCTRELDAYAQVAENQKRRGLSALDLARFIRNRVNMGESNAQISRRLGLDQTTIAHHLALLDLPPVLEAALLSGRCESPRTLYELSKLHADCPERVTALVESQADITRQAVAALRATEAIASVPRRTEEPATRPATKPVPVKSLLVQADGLCTRLEQVLDRIHQQDPDGNTEGLPQLRQRLANLGQR